MTTKVMGLGQLLSKSSLFESYAEDKAVYVKGFASVEVEDRQGDIVDPMEFNVDTFVNAGTLLRDHKYITDPYGNHVAAGKVIAAEPAEIYKQENGEFSIKSIRTGDHITTLLMEKHPELSIGSKGLFVVAEVTNELAKSEVEKGILNAFSWRGWNYGVKEGKRTRLKSVDLSEISIVHQPVNNQSTYVRIKDTDAKVLAEKLRITKLKFRGINYQTAKCVQDYLDKRHITPLEIRQSHDGFVAVLDDTSLYEVTKSVCIEGQDCDLIVAPMKDLDNDSFIATLAGEEPETLVGESEMSQDNSQSAQESRKSYRFCVVDETILQKLFPTAGRSEVLKSATLTLEDGEVADVEVLAADITDEQVSALFNQVANENKEVVTKEATKTEAATEVVAEVKQETPNVHADVVALFKAVAEQQAATQTMLNELLKDKDAKKEPTELEKLRAELEATKAALSQVIPSQDEREERSEAQKSVKREKSLGEMFSFLI